MIETLIAVAILMISIAGPLTIAQKGLTAAVYARDQVTASFLAQDVMEYIKNERDYNMRSGDGTPGEWLDGFGGCLEGSPCVVDTLTVGNGITPAPSIRVLYRSPDGYTPSSSAGQASQFSRIFYITPSPMNPLFEVTATVMVSWKNGTVENVVTMENQLFDVQR